MASSGLNFTNITPDNGAVRDLSQVVMEAIVAPEKLGKLFNVFPYVHNGDKLAVVGEFGLLGKADQGCNPTFGSDTMNTSEKTWDVADWEVAQSICYKDLESTFVKYMLQSKTSIADATANDYMDKIVRPRLESAVAKLMFRLAWFGDKAADTTANSGVLKVGTDKSYFNLNDGLWKQIFSIVTADATRRETIAANSETTFAKQKSAIMTAGVATGVIDNVIFGASPKLRQAENQVIYVTMAFKDALDHDIKASNGGSDLQWKATFAGIQEGQYNGIKLVALPQMDEIIQGYEGTTTAWNKPYRVVYTTQDNLLLGVGGADELGDLQIWFSQDTQTNRIMAKDKIGALVAQDDLIQVAY